MSSYNTIKNAYNRSYSLNCFTSFCIRNHNLTRKQLYEYSYRYAHDEKKSITNIDLNKYDMFYNCYLKVLELFKISIKNAPLFAICNTVSPAVYRRCRKTLKSYILLNPNINVSSLGKNHPFFTELKMENVEEKLIILSLAHELQHFIQVINGDMIIDHFPIVIYKNQSVNLNFCKTAEEYYNLPWEKEANNVAIAISSMIK